MAKEKRARSLFFRNKGVVAEKKKLLELKKRKITLIREIREIVEIFNGKSLDKKDAKEWLKKLPLHALSDLYRSTDDDRGLTVFDLYVRLKDEHGERVDESIKLDSEIYVNEIDLLLSKIDCIQSKLGGEDIDRSSSDGYLE